MVRAVEKVRQRLLRAAAALDAGGVPYAVAGGNAVAAWVSRVDEAAVRNTQDVDIVLRRVDLPAAIAAMTQAGFVHRHVAGIEMFLDGGFGGSARCGSRGHGRREGAPGLPRARSGHCGIRGDRSFRLLSLEALVRMKLTAFRDKDRTHLRDLIEVGLVDAGWWLACRCTGCPAPSRAGHAGRLTTGTRRN
jgi:hypothetical protein